MTLAASRTHGNVTKLKRHPSVAKTPRGWGAEFSFPRSGTVNSPTFETGAAAADFSQVPSWKPILDITCVLLSMSLWLPVRAVFNAMDYARFSRTALFFCRSASAIAENAS
jgi:hypothetical protein